MGRLVAKDAERCRAKCKTLPFEHRRSDPSRGHDAPELAVREQRDVPFLRAQASDEPIGALGNLRGRLTAGTTVPKDVPARSSLANVGGALPFVIAIVPFAEVGLDLRRRREPDQLASSPRALPRTDQYTRKLDRPQPGSEFSRLVFAFRGQRNIRATGVLAGERPCGSPVSNEIEPHEGLLGGNHFRYAAAAVSLGTPGVALKAVSMTAPYSPRRTALLQRAR